jgi:hypothetical protein
MLLLVDRLRGLKCSIAAIALCLAACGAPGDPPSATSAAPSATAARVDPARIDRVRADLPQGYEVADVNGPITPVAFWGLGTQWTADPPQCGALADPIGDSVDSTRGWSASGAGGIVYAAVARGRALDPVLVDQCGQWTMTGGKTTGSIAMRGAPTIDGAATVALETASTTVVEGGTETRSRADTVTAYLGDYVAFVTVVTDPGSPNPQLGQQFAAELLGKTVSALRG